MCKRKGIINKDGKVLVPFTYNVSGQLNDLLKDKIKSILCNLELTDEQKYTLNWCLDILNSMFPKKDKQVINLFEKAYFNLKKLENIYVTEVEKDEYYF
ncbi:MAG: hypothetical protein K5765_03230 [Clostridia bacterium]|nr:hypothetical protein [Clostridia bacterium]